MKLALLWIWLFLNCTRSNKTTGQERPQALAKDISISDLTPKLVPSTIGAQLTGSHQSGGRRLIYPGSSSSALNSLAGFGNPGFGTLSFQALAGC